MSAFYKDITRTIRKHIKRLIALVIITTLGLTAFVGINAACIDMYKGANDFYDQQKLFDLRIQSTLGLTDEDIVALSEIEEVEYVAGGYSETVDISENGQNHSADVVSINKERINLPYVVEGKLPEIQGQIAVTKKYLDETGKVLGDKIEIREQDIKDSSKKHNNSQIEDEKSILDKEEEQARFNTTEFIITAQVIDPMDTSSAEGTAAFRSSATADYLFFVVEEEINNEFYTSIYLTFKGLAGIDCYSDEYKNNINQIISFIESNIKEQREQARYNSIRNEALEKITDAENVMNEEFSKAEAEISDAWKKIDESKQELSKGESELWSNEEELKRNAQKLEEGKQQVIQNRTQAQSEFEKAEALLRQKQLELKQAYDQACTNAQKTQAALGKDWSNIAPEWNALVLAAETAAKTSLGKNPEGHTIQNDIALATQQQQAALTKKLMSVQPTPDIQAYIAVAIGLGAANASKEEIDQQSKVFQTEKTNALNQLDIAETELIANETKLNEGRVRIENAKREIALGKEELAQGEAELIENERVYFSEKQEAQDKITKAYTELDDIEMTQWYVQDRSGIASYASLDSDISSIQAIGTAFPILFLIVAILISLTTMTRMVEEERNLIGTYKALGFNNAAIAQKYFVYALIASLLGSLFGCLIGFFVLPLMLLEILKVIYTIPNVPLFFDVLYGLFGSLLFIVSIVAATGFACKNELKETPAALMRPRTPRQGARIFLERISFIWNKLKFLNKVAARNLFRYKKRFFMTLVGIAGCTALVLAGFAIRDSVTGMKPKQYDEIYTYDMMVVAYPEDNDKLIALMNEDEYVTDYLNVAVENVKVFNNEGVSETVQMIVVPAGESLESFIQIIDTQGNEVLPSTNEVLLSQNAAELLSIDLGEEFEAQNLDLDRADLTLGRIVKNYLGNNLFITQNTYEQYFGEYEANTVYTHLKEGAGNPIAYAESMLDKDFIVSSVSTAGLEERFGNDFVVLNYVIYLLVILAAALAFVVLFTLCSTNISERIRELATIKVLGFYDKEVHSYVNKETIILTLISVLCGLPLGYGLSWLLLNALKMPSIHFELTIEPLSYVIAGIISFSFTLVVNLMTNRVLDKVDMVEALKSVE